jgi:hypothetical protein
MIEQNYGKYIRDDGDAPLRAYVENPKTDQNEEKTATFPGERTNYAGILVVPTGFEPVSGTSDNLHKRLTTQISRTPRKVINQ